MKFSIFSKNKGLPRESASWRRSGGFTLIELIVVMAVATSLMTAVVIQQNSWNDRLAVNTQAYELVLMIRQAQIYALGVRVDTTGPEIDKFDVGYGIYIDEDLDDSNGKINRYIYFADRDDGSGEGNKKYDSGEEIETKTFNRGVYIEKFCGTTGGNPCNNSGGSLNQLNITFFRPDPEAIIRLLNNGGGSGGTNSPVTISLKSAGGKVYSVTVQDNGQVSITQS